MDSPAIHYGLLARRPADDRRRPGPQPRHRRRLRRPRGPGVGPPGRAPRPRRGARAPVVAAGPGRSRPTASSRARSRRRSRHDELLTRHPAARPARQRRVGVRVARAARLGLRDGRRRGRGRRRFRRRHRARAGSASPASADHPYRATDVEDALVGTTGSADDDRRRGRQGRRRARGQQRHPCRPPIPLGDGGRLHAAGDPGGAGARRLSGVGRPGPEACGSSRSSPGRPPPDDLTGAVLARDLRVGGERWSKGRRLSAADLDGARAARPGRARGRPRDRARHGARRPPRGRGGAPARRRGAWPGPRAARPQREPRRPRRRARGRAPRPRRARSSCSTGSTRSRCSRRSTGPWSRRASWSRR